MRVLHAMPRHPCVCVIQLCKLPPCTIHLVSNAAKSTNTREDCARRRKPNGQAKWVAVSGKKLVTRPLLTDFTATFLCWIADHRGADVCHPSAARDAAANARIAARCSAPWLQRGFCPHPRRSPLFGTSNPRLCGGDEGGTSKELAGGVGRADRGFNAGWGWCRGAGDSDHPEGG